MIDVGGQLRPVVEERTPGVWASQIVGRRYGEHALVYYTGHWSRSACSLGGALSLWWLTDDPELRWRLSMGIREPAVCMPSDAPVRHRSLSKCGFFPHPSDQARLDVDPRGCSEDMPEVEIYGLPYCVDLRDCSTRSAQ